MAIGERRPEARALVWPRSVGAIKRATFQVKFWRAPRLRRLTFGGRMNGVRLATWRIRIGHHDRHPLENPFVIRRIS